MGEQLNGPQAMALSVALRGLERVLLDIGSLCEENTIEQIGILLHRPNPLTPSQRADLAAQVAEARQLLGSLAGQFALPTQTEDAARMLRGKLVIAWATLEDIKSRKLNRYGEVSPTLAQTLDPGIDRLIEIVNTMEQILP